MTDKSLIEWAAGWVRDEPAGQRQRFSDGLRAELEARAEKAEQLRRETLRLDARGADDVGIVHGKLVAAMKRVAELEEDAMHLLSAARAVVSDFRAGRSCADAITGLDMRLRAAETKP